MTDSDEVKLLPCPTPWCNGKGGAPYVFERRKDVLGVYCPSCSVSTDYHPTEAAAIAQWNTRPPVVTDEVVERVARAIGPELVAYGPNFVERVARKAIASMPAVVSGGQSLDDHALPPSGLGPVSRSQSETAAAIAKGERA